MDHPLVVDKQQQAQKKFTQRVIDGATQQMSNQLHKEKQLTKKFLKTQNLPKKTSTVAPVPPIVWIAESADGNIWVLSERSVCLSTQADRYSLVGLYEFVYDLVPIGVEFPVIQDAQWLSFIYTYWIVW